MARPDGTGRFTTSSRHLFGLPHEQKTCLLNGAVIGNRFQMRRIGSYHERNHTSKEYQMLKGYRTYILGGVTIVGSVAAYLVGDAGISETINLCVTAAMGMFIRSGVNTAVKSIAK